MLTKTEACGQLHVFPYLSVSRLGSVLYVLTFRT
jgi:hypothetical protein